MSAHTSPARSVHEQFAAAADRWPERPFLNVLPETAKAYGIAAGEVTYGDALDAIDRLRDRYRAAGYCSGARVMLLLENRHDSRLPLARPRRARSCTQG